MEDEVAGTGPGRGDPEDAPFAGQVAGRDPLGEPELDVEAVAAFGARGEPGGGLGGVPVEAVHLLGRATSPDEIRAVEIEKGGQLVSSVGTPERMPDIAVQFAEQGIGSHARPFMPTPY
ncbi:MAG TPA: hypothetical protein VGQ05_05460 [Streptosporangiaceae bacterium]|nr:hypothetical protein [Streptosporangiaceae bacterium]